MKNLFAKFILILFLAVFGRGIALAQIDNTLSDISVFIEPGTVLYIQAVENEMIFVSKNTILSGAEVFTKSSIVYEKEKISIKTKTAVVKKTTLPLAISSIKQEIITKLPFTGNNSKTKIIAGLGSIPIPLTTSSKAFLANYHSDYIVFEITPFRAFQRKGFVFLEIIKITRNALFARPPTFS